MPLIFYYQKKNVLLMKLVLYQEFTVKTQGNQDFEKVWTLSFTKTVHMERFLALEISWYRF